jgi:WD40 repeat protein
MQLKFPTIIFIERRPIYTVNIKPHEETHNTTQLCNPPFVHSLSWSPSGRFLAAGLGDGSCLILSAEGRRLLEVARLGWDLGGHKAPVAAVCFPCFGLAPDVSRKGMIHGTTDDRLMVSAGNDNSILFWDLGRDMVGNDAADPAMYLTRRDETNDLVPKLNSVRVASSSDDDIPYDLLPSPSRVLFQIPHNHKPNWICSKPADAILPCSLFVADTTSCISLYSLII